jgi:hypothetical protein
VSIRGLKDLVLSARDVLYTSLEGQFKALTIQVGDAASGVAGEAISMWQQIGFISRPSKVNADGKNLQCAQVIPFNIGSETIAIGGRDTRYNEIVGNVGDGETVVYATGADGKGQGRLLLKDKGRISLYTKKDDAPGTKAMTLLMDPQTDSIMLVNSLGYGLIINATGTYLKGPGGAVKLETAGASLIATSGQAQVDGPSIVIGSAALPVVNAALVGPTGVSGRASLKTIIE